MNGGLCYGSVDQDGGNESKSSAAPKVGPFAAGGAGIEEGSTMAAAAATTAEEAKTKDDQDEEEVCELPESASTSHRFYQVYVQHR